jgi:hypothetical protein
VGGLSKAGRVLSSANEQALRKAVEALESVLSKLGSGEPAEPAAPEEGRASATVAEALALLQAPAKSGAPEPDAEIEALVRAEFGVSASDLKTMLVTAGKGLVSQELQRMTGRLPD